MRTTNPLLLLALLAATIFACEKPDDPQPPAPKTPFEVVIQNDFSELAARHAAWLTDADGKIVAFQWLHGNDSTHLSVADFPENNPLPDLSIARISIVAGSAASDTTLSVTTYTGVNNGEQVRLRDHDFRQTTLLNITFTGISSLDTIIVPDGLPFARPGWWNNFNGLYQIEHTGQIWLRLQFDGDPHWHYMALENVSGDKITTTVDPHLLPVETYPQAIQLPFVAAWKYRVDGLADAANLRFVPLGDLNRPPGGAVPVFDELQVFEPAAFDPLAPPTLPYSGYRLRLAGTSTEGEGYFFDQMLSKLPALMPQANFNLEAANLGDNRLAAVRTSADFEALVLARKNAAQPHVQWDVYLRPAPSLMYRLPDVPEDLGKIFPDLKNYNFGQAVRARAEDYQTLGSYRAVLDKIFQNEDPLWQANGGFIGKEKEL